MNTLPFNLSSSTPYCYHFPLTTQCHLQLYDVVNSIVNININKLQELFFPNNLLRYSNPKEKKFNSSTYIKPTAAILIPLILISCAIENWSSLSLLGSSWTCCVGSIQVSETISVIDWERVL
ncbi:hypothetical protein P8452_32125 [Trifolium repens]|nr:hypothetical protein P8452_32125 [Trifolium repens]